jgi:hypothetical protein
MEGIAELVEQRQDDNALEKSTALFAVRAGPDFGVEV